MGSPRGLRNRNPSPRGLIPSTVKNRGEASRQVNNNAGRMAVQPAFLWLLLSAAEAAICHLQQRLSMAKWGD